MMDRKEAIMVIARSVASDIVQLLDEHKVDATYGTFAEVLFYIVGTMMANDKNKAGDLPAHMRQFFEYILNAIGNARD